MRYGAPADKQNFVLCFDGRFAEVQCIYYAIIARMHVGEVPARSPKSGVWKRCV